MKEVFVEVNQYERYSARSEFIEGTIQTEVVIYKHTFCPRTKVSKGRFSAIEVASIPESEDLKYIVQALSHYVGVNHE